MLFISIGHYPVTSLADARDKAADYRRLITNNIDPIDWKREQKEFIFFLPICGLRINKPLGKLSECQFSQKFFRSFLLTFRSPSSLSEE